MTALSETALDPAPRMDCSAGDWLRMLQFGDSALPTGAFAFSHGLESALERRVVHDHKTLQSFVKTSMEQSASGDAVALLVAHDAALKGRVDVAIKADRYVFNRKLNEEGRVMSIRTGKKLTEMASRITSHQSLQEWLRLITTNATHGTHPVSLAMVFAALGLPAQGCFAVHQYGVATAILSAALRLMKIDHFGTQAILFELTGDIPAAFLQSSSKSLEDMSNYAPVIDLLAATHVKAHIRMFMN